MIEQTNPVSKPPPNNDKLDFLNLIKMFIILPGIVYHVIEYLNFPEHLVVDHWFANLLITYSRFFYYTAFVATLAVFFPFGLDLSKKIFNLKRSIIAFTGLAFLSYVYYDTEGPFFGSEWTFYHFIVSSFVILHFVLPLLKNRFFNLSLLIVSFLLLWIPFWSFDYSFLPYGLKTALIGDCKNTDYGEWPLLPWFFLCTLATSFCVLLKNNSWFRNISKIEIMGWLIPIFGLGIPFWGEYFNQPTDTHFSCGVFARPQWVFYAHILPYLFLIRLNYVSAIREKLLKNNFFITLRKISWINNFGTCYLLSLLTIGILSLVYDGDTFEAGTKHYMYIFSVGIAFLVPELITRALKKSKKNN